MSVIEFGIHKAFFTPIIQFNFSKHENYFFPDIEKKENKPKTWEDSLNTSFPNIKDDDAFVEKDVRDNLKKDLLSDVEKVFHQMNIDHKINFCDFWYNVYHTNQGQENHWHMNYMGDTQKTYFCGIYFNKNSKLCQTIFSRGEDHFYRMYNFDEFANSPLNVSFSPTYIPSVNDGNVILFPPYLFHRVVPFYNPNNDMRLTFSFNLMRKS